MAVPPFRSNIEHVRQGEPGKASVVRRPDQQLEQDILYLKDLVESALLGKALFIRDATLKAGMVIGQPVYYNSATQQYELAFAATDNCGQSTATMPASSSYVRGLLYKKTNATLGDILVMGTATLDISAAVTETAVADGNYYLSAVDPGKLTQQEPPVSIYVLEKYSNGEITFVPSHDDFVKDHIHLRYDLSQVVADSSTETGWLAANDAVFNDKAPAGAIYGYNLSQHIELQRTWPPIPVKAAQLIWDRSDGNFGTVVPDGLDGLVQFTSHGIWWMSNVVGMRPWDYYDKGSISSSSGGPLDGPSSLTLFFLRMTFNTNNTTVTSLTSLKPTILKVLDCDGDVGSTGDLSLDLLLGLLQQDTDEEGYQVIKTLDGDTQELRRGPVAEGIFAGTNIALASTAQRTVGADTLHMGRVTVTNDFDMVGRELPMELVRLDDVRERFTGIVMYLAFPAGQDSGVDIKIKIPYTDLPTIPSVKIRALVIVDNATIPPPLTLEKYIIPLGSATASAVIPSTSAQTAVTFTTTLSATTMAVNDTFLLESAAISVTAGDTLFCRIARNGAGSGADALSSTEIGLIRLGAIIQ